MSSATNGSNTEQAQHDAIIGNDSNFWLYSSRAGFDLTHPPTPHSPPVSPVIRIETSTSPITIDPAKSALVIIDMQNFFLSPLLGGKKGSAGHKACDELVNHAIPAARKAGIRVLWVNWGLTQEEVDSMPPAVKRAFGFGEGLDKHGNKMGHEGSKGLYKGLGSDMGSIKDLESGQEIEVGGILMRDTWNAGLFPPLNQMYKEGKKLGNRPDIWIHKNRMSAMWGSGTDLEKYLEKEGIRTLFFTGVNTDQCVGGTYQDCFSKGYDCILLGDGAGTSSPEHSQQCMEFNASNTWGFLTSCQKFAEGVGNSL